MKLIRTGSWCKIEDAPRRDAVFNILDLRFSYLVEGHQFAESFRAGMWDGRAHLVRRGRGDKILFPAGLWDEVVSILQGDGLAFEVQDRRESMRCVAFRDWTGPEAREYQSLSAMNALLKGGGILRVAIRGGKTLIAALVAFSLKQRALFVVTSNLLVEQTAQAVGSYIGGPRVTMIGAGYNDDSGDIVVASIQSLTTRWMDCNGPGRRWFGDFRRKFGLLVVDELHHASAGGEEWRDVLLRIEAKHKLGLSATIKLDEGGQCDEDAIWLHGICGPIVANVGTSELIEAGWLVQPDIVFLTHSAPKMLGDLPYQSVYSQGVAECAQRNSLIARLAVQRARASGRILVDCWRIGHARRLAQLIRQDLPHGVGAGLMLGTTPIDERRAILESFVDGRTPVIVSNVMGEGVDVPVLDTVINAEGGQGQTPVLQRLRNLTLCKGKEHATVYDFVDEHHPTLLEHSRSRWAVYKGERAFHVSALRSEVA